MCEHSQMFLRDAKSKQLAVATLKNGLYYLDAHTLPHAEANIAIKIKRAWTWEEWHRRLGHIGISGLHNLHRKTLLMGSHYVIARRISSVKPASKERRRGYRCQK